MRCVHHRGSYWTWVGCGLHKHRPSGAASQGIRHSLPVFNAAVDREHRLVVPSSITRLGGEEIPIVLMSACPGHYIYARSPAAHLAHIVRKATSLKMRIRFGDKVPIALGAEVLKPAQRIGHTGHVIVATGFK